MPIIAPKRLVDLRCKVSELTQDVAAQTANRRLLEGQLDALRAENERLQADVEGLTRQLESAKDELAENMEWREHGAALSGQVSDLKQKLVAKNIIQQQLSRAQVEAAAMSQAIQSFCRRCGNAVLGIFCDGCPLDAAKRPPAGSAKNAPTEGAGAAMLRVVEAARECLAAMEDYDAGRLMIPKQKLEDALAELDGDK